AQWDGGMLGGREARPGIGGFVGATHVLVGFLFLAGVISGRWPPPEIAFQRNPLRVNLRRDRGEQRARKQPLASASASAS
ncbi:MAG: hypothetical protein QOI41_6427, partial [Myxococcales bacterium]|nr:hypothetical protein [Myxococcales bacterium]